MLQGLERTRMHHLHLSIDLLAAVLLAVLCVWAERRKSDSLRVVVEVLSCLFTILW